MWFHLCFVGYIREYVYGGGRVYIDDTDHFWVYIMSVDVMNVIILTGKYALTWENQGKLGKLEFCILDVFCILAFVFF